MSRSRRGNRSNRTPSEPNPPRVVEDEDGGGDKAFMEAIRRSQSEFLTAAEKHKRDEEADIEKAIQLSLLASTSGDSSALSSSTACTCKDHSSNQTDQPSSSNRDAVKCTCNGDNSVSEVFFSPPETSVATRKSLDSDDEEHLIDSGSDSNARKRRVKSVDKKESNGAAISSLADLNGCDSTVVRGRGNRGGRGGARGRRTPEIMEVDVSSTRGRGRGKRKATETAVAPKAIDLVDIGDGSDSEEHSANIRGCISTIYSVSDEDELTLSDGSEEWQNEYDDDYNPDECSSTTNENGPKHGGQSFANGLLNNAQVASRMKSLFEQSLKLHLTGQYMEPCEAIRTRLYPHQMYALAWMSNRENMKKNLGMRGGILADDMGLGKTLSIIALVLTNFHDEKPMARPLYGYRRQLSRMALRYMPIGGESSKFSRTSDSDVGAKARRKAANTKGRQKSSSALEVFDHLKPRKKDNKQKVKSTKKQRNFDDSSEEEESGTVNASSYLDLGEDDEFDAMLTSGSLSEKLDLTQESLKLESKVKLYHDNSSDEEEFKNLTKEEVKEMMKPKTDSKFNLDGFTEVEGFSSPTTTTLMGLKQPSMRFSADALSSTTTPTSGKLRQLSLSSSFSLNKPCSSLGYSRQLNLDGATSFDDTDSDYEEPCSSSNIVTKSKRRKVNGVSPEPSKKRNRVQSPSLLDDIDTNGGSESPIEDFSLPDINSADLPDLDDDHDRSVEMNAREAKFAAENVKMLELSEQQRKNLKIPPKEIAQLNGRRRATLIVTPASLIGQWLGQIELHVHKNVNLDIFVHHGQSKSLIALELQDKDIVLTTYGTLMAEFKEDMQGPLLRAKWLRVVLDEGHQIKNHRSKTFKAASNLDTQRKWIVSGTPIQNNLTELWALLNWLGEPNYGNNRPMFKNQIENAIKKGHPRGIERLQVLMETICIRRTKSDEVEGKPLVSLPTKIVTLKELEFNPEEKIVYDAYHKKGKELILKYMRRGTLLRNYAHVFAVMMRLRQLCCHRELLPVKWHEVDMNELTALAAKELEPGESTDPNGGLGEDDVKRLAEQLRQMIKDGMSDECSICLSEFDQPVITPCAHVYCRPCITTHIETTAPPASCPLCRGLIKISLLLEAAQDEESEDGASSDEFEDVMVDTSSTKVNAVMKELEICRRKDPTEKSIIVSQFTSLLSIIQPLLTQGGYNWTRLDGSMSVRDRMGVIENFQNKGKNTPTVLLLSLRAGGVGLNLTAASRLFLLDPAWNPSTEEQCFDRIHRLGQTRNVEIIKFVMKDSIEQRMLRIQDKKRDLISGAFRQTENERREQRIQDIRDIFDL